MLVYGWDVATAGSMAPGLELAVDSKSPESLNNEWQHTKSQADRRDDRTILRGENERTSALEVS